MTTRGTENGIERARTIVPSKRPLSRTATLGAVDLEHGAAQRRAAVGVYVLAIVWPLTTVLDVLYAHVGARGALSDVLGVRVVTTLYVWALALRFRSAKDMSERELAVHRPMLIGVLLGALAMMAVFLGGFGSLYGVGAVALAGSIGIFPTRWRDQLKLAVPLNLLYPAILLASTFFAPIPQADLADAHARVWLLVYTMGIGLSLTHAVTISHLTWSMRREAFAQKRVGRYRLIRRIGKGGMGEVWAATHLGLGREVALKLLEVRDDDRSVATERFEREVRATSELTHPNTVRVYDFGSTEDGLLFYAMELLEGEHLGALVKREGALPPARALYLGQQATRALAEAHALGIVHRDVKAENLFVTIAGGERDFVKVLDFGVAKLLGSIDSLPLTQSGVLAGTPATMSPETIQGETVGPQADVYGLGAVLYLMLAGRYPFDGDVRAATMLSHLGDPVIPPSVKGKTDVPRDLEAIVMKCLEKDPADRFADASALALALESCGLAGRYRPSRGAPVRSLPPSERVSDEPTLSEKTARPRPKTLP